MPPWWVHPASLSPAIHGRATQQRPIHGAEGARETIGFSISVSGKSYASRRYPAYPGNSATRRGQFPYISGNSARSGASVLASTPVVSIRPSVAYSTTGVLARTLARQGAWPVLSKSINRPRAGETRFHECYGGQAPAVRPRVLHAFNSSVAPSVPVRYRRVETISIVPWR